MDWLKCHFTFTPPKRRRLQQLRVEYQSDGYYYFYYYVVVVVGVYKVRLQMYIYQVLMHMQSFVFFAAVRDNRHGFT